MLFVKFQKDAAMKVVEVGCKRFFFLSGYVSAPCHTQLGVRIYKRLVLLSSILQNMYIDDNWVANEYLRQLQGWGLEEGEHKRCTQVLES
ncbi:hypothetical protein ACHAWF_000117 [Thalassiosira exigua]